MGRAKLTDAEKEIRDRKKLAAILGLEVEEEVIVESASEAQQRKREDASREAEAVIFFVQDRRKLLQKECKLCGGVFAVNRQNVAFCSDECRKRWLDKIGIVWDPTKNPEERWEFKEPLVIPPQTLQPLLDHLESHQEIERVVEEPEPQPQETYPDVDHLLADILSQ